MTCLVRMEENMEGEDHSSPYKIESIHTLVPYLFLIHYDSLYTKRLQPNNTLCGMNSMIRNKNTVGGPWMSSRMGFLPFGPSTCEGGYASLVCAPWHEDSISPHWHMAIAQRILCLFPGTCLRHLEEASCALRLGLCLRQLPFYPSYYQHRGRRWDRDEGERKGMSSEQ